MAYGITNLNQLIDTSEIIRGCEIINKAADSLGSYGESVAAISGVCNKDVLSADGKSMEPVIEELGLEIKACKEALYEWTAQIEAKANEIHAAQYREYQDYVEYQNSLKASQEEQ